MLEQVLSQVDFLYILFNFLKVYYFDRFEQADKKWKTIGIPESWTWLLKKLAETLFAGKIEPNQVLVTDIEGYQVDAIETLEPGKYTVKQKQDE